MQIGNPNPLFSPAASKPKSTAGSTPSNAEPATLGVAKPTDADPSKEFLKLAKMNPLDRMRANILKSMGLTEETLAKMPPAKQAAVQQKIAETIREQMQKSGAQSGSVVDVTA